MSKKHLFLLTIGPVQSFIAQARKAQDLYGGSYLLTQLIRHGIEQVGRNEVVFPFAYPQEDKAWNSVTSLPNRFLAVIDKNKKELLPFGKAIEATIQNEFKRIAQESLKGRKKPKGFDAQISRHLAIHWIFHPLDEQDYQTSYKETIALLNGIKNTRPFEQFLTNNQLGEAGRKCSLDGENNALFFGRKKPKRLTSVQDNNTETVDGFLTEEKEGLSAVSFVKRYGLREGSFQSTAEIAVKYDENELSPDHQKIFDCYRKLFGDKKHTLDVCNRMFTRGWINKVQIKDLSDENKWNNHFDYQPVFEENLTSKAIPHPEQLRLAKILQSKLAASFKTKYYALILFDGDKMGEKLSNAKSSKNHSDFSKLLSEYATVARGILKGKGETVYTGGDDFLGFVNLHHLFGVMEELRKQFKLLVSNKAKAVLGLTEEFSFSAGIVIAQYKTPLSEVLKTARKVEKYAKNDGGRNAFCITVMKHSGEIQESVFKWGEANENWKGLEFITKQLSKDVFSNKFITNLTLELYQLAGVKLEGLGNIPFGAVFTEFRRLLGRALIGKKDKETDKAIIKQMATILESLFLNSDEIRLEGKSTQNFIHALHIVDFLSRETK